MTPFLKASFSAGTQRSCAATQYGKLKLVLAGVLLLLLVCVSLFLFFSKGDPAKEPLYWVAPMDSNYRRDGPGKSPMGMDLVPVYAEDLTAGNNDEPGAVYVSPTLQQQISVRTEPVKKGRLEQSLSAYGELSFDKAKERIMTAPTAAKIDYMVMEYVGEKVLKGLPLYAISADVLVRAQEVYLRALAKGDRSAIIASEQTLANLGFDQKLMLELKRDGAAQRSVVFRAPISGVISELNARQGSYVKPGTTILSVQPTDTLWAFLDLPATAADHLKIGDTLVLTSPSLPGKSWPAKIDFIDPQIDASSQSLRVRCTLNNDRGELKPNLFIQAQVALPAKAPAVLAPYQAIIRLGNENRVVLALGEGFFKSIAVTLGAANSDWVEVTSGLEEGDEIVSSAHFLIDSESSKTSDFKRFEPQQARVRQSQTRARVEEIWLEQGKLRLAHEPIEDWNMGAMTMNFLVADGLNIESLKIGDYISIKVVDDPEVPLYIVAELEKLSEAQ